MSPALPHCCVYSFPLATWPLLTDLRWETSTDPTLLVGSTWWLHILFAVFVTAPLAVLIRSEAASVSFQMGLGERGSQRNPCHNLFTLEYESKALGISPPMEVGGSFLFEE